MTGSTAAVAAPTAPDTPLPPRRTGPIESRFSLALNADDVWYTAKSFDLFSTNDVGGTLGGSVGYAVWMKGPLSLSPELGVGADSQSASGLFGGAISSTKLQTVSYYTGATLRYALLSFLEPEARIALGLSTIKADIYPSSGPGKLEEKSLSPFGSLGAGVTFRSPPAALGTRSGSLESLVIGLTVEGGYVLGGSVDLSPTPSPAMGRIATQDARLGSLDRSGPYVRVGLGARF